MTTMLATRTSADVEAILVRLFELDTSIRGLQAGPNLAGVLATASKRLDGIGDLLIAAHWRDATRLAALEIGDE